MNNYCVSIKIPYSPFDTSYIKQIVLNSGLSLTQDLHLMCDSKSMSPDFTAWLCSIGLTVNWIPLFYKPAFFIDKEAHVDAPVDFVKINWVYQGENSLMHWYSPLDDYAPKRCYTPQGQPFTLYSMDKIRQIHSEVIGFPSIVQVGIPHNVSTGDTSRYCVSMIPKTSDGKIISMTQAQNIFKDYICA
jgi:hypothetical protein